MFSLFTKRLNLFLKFGGEYLFGTVLILSELRKIVLKFDLRELITISNRPI